VYISYLQRQTFIRPLLNLTPCGAG
jgi:hypothetical protein